MKILLAVDGSVCSDAAAQELAKRPWPPDTEVKVITVVEIPAPVGMEPWAMSPDYFENLERTLRQAGQSVLDSTLPKLKTITDKTLKISSEIIQGSPAQVIVDEAKSWGADLIILGSRGLGIWNRLLLGSVSNAVVQHAKCSVEVVRTPQEKQPDK
ncbi:MAG TPA: universal stress protein [Anaerolineales bacterium]|nr:universal stress protein [Anaerolineales bacterium]